MFFILLPGRAQSGYTVSDTILKNQINLNNSTIKNSKIVLGDETIYEGLDSAQILLFQELNFNINALTNKLVRADSLVEINKIYNDTLLKIVRELSINQRKLWDLKRFQDSIQQSGNGEELYRKELLDYYNDNFLNKYGREFWEMHPKFNPMNNKEWVYFLEKTYGETYKKIYSIPYSNKDPEWLGIKINGIDYKFGSDDFNSLLVNVSEFGLVSIKQLKENYSNYLKFKNDKSRFINESVTHFLKYQKNKDCSKPYGNLIIKNETDFNVVIYISTFDNNGAYYADKKTTKMIPSAYIHSYTYQVYENISNQKESKLIIKGAYDIFGCSDTVLTISN